KGGDWELEVSTGKIETPLVFEPEVLAAYEYVLNSFGAATNFSITSSLRKVATGDFNKDGNLDLALASTGTNRVSIALGDGTGKFGAATYFNTDSPTELYTWSVAVADFNKDGNSDLVTANNLTSDVSLLLGNGDGTFGSATYFAVGSSPYTVAVGDFNADGNSDLATANKSSNDISILLGNGNGTFGTATNLSVGSTPYFVLVGDFNKDGKSDFATANSGSSDVSILLQNADGTFGIATNFTVGNSPNYIALGDFNGDNNPDLATSNEGSNDVSILLGSGTGSFSAATNFGVATQPLAIASGDFNADGKLDLATANNGSGDVSVLFGSGNGSFGTATNLTVGTNPQGIAVGDFNKDGLSDLATANFGSYNVSVLLNTTPVVNFGATTYAGTEATADTVVNIPVTLSATPLSDVVVPIVIDPSSTATENSDYTFSPPTVTFPAGTTTLTQDVAVTIKPDNLPENDETAILNFGAITGGVADTTKQTTLTIAANGSVSYAVAADIASMDEGNSGTTPLTFTVNRSDGTGAASSINYAIGGTATNVSDYNNIGGTSGATGISGTINFAVAETSKTITLNVVGDGLVEPDETVEITLSNPVAPGPTPTFTAATATTTITNDDSAGFSIAPTNITATEGGATGSYKIKLTSEPTAPVNISFNTGNAISPIATPITFDSTNWNVDQTVTVSAIDDNVAQGTHSGTIAHTVTSTDASYNAKVIPDVTASITDNDSPGVSIVQSAGSTNIAEGGATATYGVVLTTAPAANVTINFDTGTQISAIAPLTFTPSNWNVAQNVTVSAIEDSIAQGTRSGTITHTSVSTDTLYNGLAISPVTATIADNDTAGVSISPTSTTATEGFAGTYRVKLKSEPLAPVTLSFATGDQINPIAPITFDSTNWNVDQTVTVSAIDDSIAQGTHGGTIAHTSASTDTKYNALTISPVTATIADNDTAGVSISPTSTTATEGLTNGTYSVQLTSVPSAPVTISFANGDEINAIADVTFDSTNWNLAKAVTVTATDDAVVEGNHTGSISHTAQSADSKYSAIPIPGVTVAITDNDVASPPPPPIVDPVPPTPVAPPPPIVDPVPPTPVAPPPPIVDPVPPTPVAPPPPIVDPVPPTPV
ncbi:FG-GAP-like repeat-containing protein, partial [Microcoleus sp. Pol1B3]